MGRDEIERKRCRNHPDQQQQEAAVAFVNSKVEQQGPDGKNRRRAEQCDAENRVQETLAGFSEPRPAEDGAVNIDLG